MDPDGIASQLRQLPGWTLTENAIEKTFTFTDFDEAWAWLTSVVAVAKQINHHPDIFVHWNTVTLSIFSHDVNGITSRDFTLAAAIQTITP